MSMQPRLTDQISAASESMTSRSALRPLGNCTVVVRRKPGVADGSALLEEVRPAPRWDSA